MITKEMADYLAIKSYLAKHNILLLLPKFRKHIKAVICHFLSVTHAEDISNSLEDLGLNVISVRQFMTNRRAPNGQIHVETPFYSWLP
jgi:hypothetical protein